jgi:hypothetical protein
VLWGRTYVFRKLILASVQLPWGFIKNNKNMGRAYCPATSRIIKMELTAHANRKMRSNTSGPSAVMTAMRLIIYSSGSTQDIVHGCSISGALRVGMRLRMDAARYAQHQQYRRPYARLGSELSLHAMDVLLWLLSALTAVPPPGTGSDPHHHVIGEGPSFPPPEIDVPPPDLGGSHRRLKDHSACPDTTGTDPASTCCDCLCDEYPGDWACKGCCGHCTGLCAVGGGGWRCPAARPYAYSGGVNCCSDDVGFSAESCTGTTSRCPSGQSRNEKDHCPNAGGGRSPRQMQIRIPVRMTSVVTSVRFQL